MNAFEGLCYPRDRSCQWPVALVGALRTIFALPLFEQTYGTSQPSAQTLFCVVAAPCNPLPLSRTPQLSANTVRGKSHPPTMIRKLANFQNIQLVWLMRWTTRCPRCRVIRMRPINYLPRISMASASLNCQHASAARNAVVSCIPSSRVEGDYSYCWNSTKQQTLFSKRLARLSNRRAYPPPGASDSSRPTHVRA